MSNADKRGDNFVPSFYGQPLLCDYAYDILDYFSTLPTLLRLQ